MALMTLEPIVMGGKVVGAIDDGMLTTVGDRVMAEPGSKV